jgi:hypothetical protein
MTEQEYEAERQFYLTVWRRALRELLSWPDARIDEWVSERDATLMKPKNLIVHETPLYYVACEVVAECVVPRPTRAQLDELVKRIEEAISGTDPRLLVDPRFDWNAARKRLFDLIETATDSR